jgi:hypothetical protein
MSIKLIVMHKTESQQNKRLEFRMQTHLKNQPLNALLFSYYQLFWASIY